ncbi:MT0933-like antitoxin protein [Amycolatopsis marina]|uniref:MT0933-like antitoxin protein n=1 Tax=Amycolatopsis marina TaxID=490629 RepID=A0A1I0V8E1_9PSEU|nr:antitoxin [Amycolatopsis marina]SFA72654.1 MT0933-like antitoxin protein [Amycolatopsis marina]
MGINFDDMKNKAKDALGQHSDKAEQGVDKASEAAKSRFGEHSDKIDSATEKAKGFINRDEGGEGGQQQPPQ